MLTLHSLISIGHARAPDLLYEGYANQSLSGRQHSEEPDQIFWNERDTENLYVTSIVDGQLQTVLLGEQVRALVGLLDYDGDGQSTLIVYGSSADYIDAHTNVPLEIALSQTCSLSAVGDVNGDSIDELASITEIGLAREGGFYTGAQLSAGAQMSSEDASDCWRSSIQPLGDIDGDGRADFAQATITNVSDYSSQVDGILDLYLGCGYQEPLWSPFWRYDHPIYSPWKAIAADVDGDRENEIVALSVDSLGTTLYGELFILDDILDPLGPTMLISKEISGGYNYGRVSFENAGDVDYDGDDEVLFTMDDYLFGIVVRLIDAEPTDEGLLAPVGPTFDLPPPAETESYVLYDSIQAHAGDYDGDGFKDVAVLAHAEIGDPESGIIAIWLTTPPEGALPPVSIILPEDLSYCEPPVEPETADTGARGEAPKTASCAGCASVNPRSTWLVLALPWLVLRKR